ncbi:MAG: Gfo/Idh/MocA family protein [Methyloligellaceae bacterium]
MKNQSSIGIGIVGGGYMGKAHAVAMAAVGTVFDTALRPTLEVICTTTEAGAAAKARAFGFNRATADWRDLVDDEKVAAVIIATPADSHREIAERAIGLGKPVFCEKPLAATLDDARAMTVAAEQSGTVNMSGFNYIRTPASQLALEMIRAGEIGTITAFRGEHTEDFYANPDEPATWRAQGRANGAMGDLAPHMVNAALTLAGPIKTLVADIATIIKERPGQANSSDRQPVGNDDFGQFICRFSNGARGQLMFSRVAHGRKMGYIYEITGTKGALRFNQEDQNSLWFYDAGLPADRNGFRQILTGPEHPDYVNFCLGPGHGTGYQDQIIIEARDFLQAIETGSSLFPTFRDGLAVSEVLEAAYISSDQRRWVGLEEIQTTHAGGEE